MFRLRRNSEFVLPPKRRHFASETAKHRGFCEAASLTAFGPYDVATRPSSLPRRLDTAVLGKSKTVKHRGRTRTNRGSTRGLGAPLYTFSLGFGAAETAFHLTCVKEMNNKLTKLRNLCSHPQNHLPRPLYHIPPPLSIAVQVDKRDYLWYNTTVIGGLPLPKEISL